MEVSGTDQGSSWGKLLVFMAMLLAGMFIGNFLAFLVCLPFVGLDLDVLVKIIEDPASIEGSRPLIILMQGIIAVVTFIVTPWVYSKYFEGRSMIDRIKRSPSNGGIYLLLSLLVVALLPFNSGLVEAFQPQYWPESWQGFLEEISILDSQYDDMAAFFIDFDSVGEFLLAFVVMSILPAVGEELVFRGYLQPYLIGLTKNVFAGIFISSLIFGVFHFQVSGLLPRMLLGMVFGYLYFWSGNIYLPIFGHFVNNAFSLILAGLYKLGYIDIDISENLSVSWVQFLISLVLSISIYLTIRRMIFNSYGTK